MNNNKKKNQTAQIKVLEFGIQTWYLHTFRFPCTKQIGTANITPHHQHFTSTLD